MILRFVLELVLIMVIARAFWRMVDGVLQGLSGRPSDTAMRSVQMERDPVCGTFVVPEHAVTLDDGSRRVYFCSAGCRDKYRARTA